MKIVLDAGHGHDTPGKRTPDGMREYEFNRMTAHYAKHKLLTYEEVEIVYSHDDLRDVSLSERSNLANRLNAAAFVSIHANAFGTGSWNMVQGIETYVPAVYSPPSNILAAHVHTQLIQVTGRRDRGIKTADFHVLRETKMASILCECGFMTNMEEAQLLKSERYRKMCGEAIAGGVAAYFTLKEKKNVRSPSLFKVQLGAFKEKKNADQLAAAVKKKGYEAFIFKEGGLYKVQAGAYSKKENAAAMAAALKSQGFSTFVYIE
jgi:N-acetylmuramoyl-L-alanine amidase